MALSPTTHSPTVLGVPRTVYLQPSEASAEREHLVALNGELQQRCVLLQKRVDVLEKALEKLQLEGGGIANEQLEYVDRSLKELREYSRILERQNSELVISTDKALSTQRAELGKMHEEDVREVTAKFEARLKEALAEAERAARRQEEMRIEFERQRKEDNERREKEKAELEGFVAAEYKKLLDHAETLEDERRQLQSKLAETEAARQEAARCAEVGKAARLEATKLTQKNKEAEKAAAEAKEKEKELGRSVEFLQKDFAAAQRENEGLRLQLLQETETLRRQMERERKELERIQREKTAQQKELSRQLEEAAAERDAHRRQTEGALYEKALLEARCEEAERVARKHREEAHEMLKQEREKHERDLEEERRHHAKLQRLHTAQLQQLDEKYKAKIAALKGKGTEKAEQKARELQRHYELLQDEQRQRQQRREQKDALEKEIARGKAVAELESLRQECEARCRRAEDEVEKVKAKQQRAVLEADALIEGERSGKSERVDG